MIAHEMHWTAQQVKELKRLVRQSQSGAKPVFVKDWPGPGPSSGPRPIHQWVKFIDLPVIKSVTDELFSVSFTIESAVKLKLSRTGSRKRKRAVAR